MLPMSALRHAKGADGHAYRISENIPVNRDNRSSIHVNYIELNRMMCKFNIAPNPLRIAAFLGNAMVETQWFQRLHENNASAKYWPWDGRGFLQLTWPDNYVKYWKFLGRSIPETLEKELGESAKKVNKERNNTSFKDSNYPALTPQMVQWREDTAVKPAHAAESSGAYWAWTGAMRYADKPTAMQRQVQNITKPGFRPVVYYSCQSYGQIAATVNFGSTPKDLAKIARVNGIVARYQAYTSALMVLADGTSFPCDEGHGWDNPAGYERRNV